MVVDTRLGPIDVAEDALFRFPYGLPGFPGDRRFFLHGDEGAVHWLLSADGDRIGLPVIDPLTLVPDYLDRLPADVVGPALLVRTVVVPRPRGRLSTSLVAPVLLDRERRLGMQIILADSEAARHVPVGIA
jgi:flagellar assembly factor FliW